MRLNGLRVGGLALAGLAAPALAVGLSPIRKEGPAAGPAKAFYLTVINPYPEVREFVVYQDGRPVDGGEERPREIAILPARLAIKAKGDRRITVIVRDLAPGETRETRVCAELAKHEGMVHARVCSTLVARRIVTRG